MIFVVTGQTASGKTAHALELAKRHNGELINADSRQIYKGLDIVTGKDLDLTTHTFTSIEKFKQFDIGYYETTSSTRIWLYDVLSPQIPFSAFDYVRLVNQVIKDLQSRGKVPIIVGGTYFYISQLLYGTSVAGGPNWELRRELSTKSIEELQQMLSVLDANLFTRLNESEKRNPQRLIRKIEIMKSHGSIHPIPEPSDSYSDVTMIGLCHADKDSLENKIRTRIVDRLNKGAIDEVKRLLTNGYTPHDPGMKTIGYPQIISYLADEMTREELVNLWCIKEMQYAKRQMTLMKRNNGINWITV